MEHHDNENFELIEELNALIAATYSGGNSWADRSARARAQRRDRFGRFAEMFGLMKFKLRLGAEYGARAGEEVNVQGVYVGAGNTETSGWMYVKGDANVPDGFYEIDGNNFREVLASLDPEYLRSRGIELGKDASGNAVGKRTLEDIPSTDDVNYMRTPPGFVPSTVANDSFVSEDGDISIDGDGSGFYDVSDNLDRSAAPIRNVEGLANALKAVYEIDKTRSNYEPAEGEAPVAPETPETPVAEIPEGPAKMDPAGLTNAELLAEANELIAPDGTPNFGVDRERASAIQDELDTRFDMEPEGYEGDWFEDNADFVRDPSKRTEGAPTAPVAELPSDAESVETAEADIQNSEQVADETADPETVDAAEEVIAEEAPVVEQATIKPPRSPREPSIGAFTGRMLELLDGVTDPKQVQDIINDQELTYIDFETSGFSAVPGDGALNRPLQMGIVKVKNGEVVDRKNIWMNPEEQLSEWSKNNLKNADGEPLTDEWLAQQGSMRDGLQEAVDFIGPDAILAGQNVQFDLEVLTRSLREQGIDFSFAGTLDSRDLGKKTLPTWSAESPVGPTKTDAEGNKSASNSLGDLIAFLKDEGYDVNLDNWHSADADAQATHELVQALLQRAVDNNVDMGVLTDKAQRDAESASEWATYNEQYSQYVADLGNYFDQTNDPNKEERLALAQPLTPESFGLTESATEDPAVAFDALADEIAVNYPLIADNMRGTASTPLIRILQNAQSDTRPNDEIQAEIRGLVERLQEIASNGDRALRNKISSVKDSLESYARSKQKDFDEEQFRNSPEGIARAQAAEQQMQNRMAEMERLQQERADRYQAWVDNGGPEAVQRLREQIRQDGLAAYRDGTTPEDFDNYANRIQQQIEDLITVDGEIVPEASQNLGGNYQMFGQRASQQVASALRTYEKEREEDLANPEKLEAIFAQYDEDGSARALFESGASYDEIYENLKNQNTGWAEGYDPYSGMRERGGSSLLEDSIHGREILTLQRALRLRGDAQPVVENVPDLTDAINSASESGDTQRVGDLVERQDAINSVADSISNGTPISGPPADVVESTEEVVPEIGPRPELKMMGFYVLNPSPTEDDMRFARDLEDVPASRLERIIVDAITANQDDVMIEGNQYPLHTVVLALQNKGEDAEAFVATVLDSLNGDSANLNALGAYRSGQSEDVVREGTTNAVPYTQEQIVAGYLQNTPVGEALRQYFLAYMNGFDSVSISVENFGQPSALGDTTVSISTEDLRQGLVNNGVDMDALESAASGDPNQSAREQIAEDAGLTPEQTPVRSEYRNDWRAVLFQNSDDFRAVYFIDKNGNPNRFERREDGKWYDLGNINSTGISTAKLIRKMERNADPEALLEIDSGEPWEDIPDFDATLHTFQFSGGEEEELSIDDVIADDAWMHVTGGDLERLRELERAGVRFNVLDKMAELFQGSERRGDDEVVTETHDYIERDASGNPIGRWRFEVVVTRTPDEYFYTYVRRINLDTNKSWSARVGHMSQSPFATFNNYRREIAKFHASMFKPGGPVAWFDADATRRRKKRDVMDPDTNQWVHAKEIQHNPQTMANIRALLGIDQPTTTDVRRAENEVMKAILDSISKYRFNDRWMGIMAERISERYGRNIDKTFMYQVADAYEAHLTNQSNLDRYGTWVSADQRTPLDAGDRVQHEDGRTGTVRKRLGWVDSLGRYRYSDYVEVRWDNGDTTWTTSRKNTLLITADGTDGSERIGYRDGYEDPRASYGTSVRNPVQAEAPDTTPSPAPEAPSTQTATRGDNSELTLADGTIVPEHVVGARPTPVVRTPNEIVRGDFIGVLNDEAVATQAPVLSDAILNEDGTKYSVDIAVRQSDGTYKVQTVSFPNSQTEFVQVSTYPVDAPEDRGTPAQTNELLELLGSKILDERGELPAGLVRQSLYTAALVGDNVSRYYSREEMTDILNELRALPDRNPTPAEDAAMLASEAALEAERNNNPDASQEFSTLADSANVVASQEQAEEAETTSETETPAEEEPVAPAEEATPAESERPAMERNVEALVGTQILDRAWLDEAPSGTYVYSTSSGWVYQKTREGVWKRVQNGVTTDSADMNLLAQRISSGYLYVGNRAPSTLAPGSQTSASSVEEESLPRSLTELTPDVSGGWADVASGTQINNPEWFSGAPTGTRVGLRNVEYEKKDDGLWYPTSGNFASTGYSSDDLASFGLLSRSQQENAPEEVAQAWELLPEGSEITSASYISEAPPATRVSMQMSDGSAPRTFVRLGDGSWELEGTNRRFSSDQVIYRVNNSDAYTFTSLPSADTTEVSTTVSSLAELNGFAVGTSLRGNTEAGHIRTFRRNDDGTWTVRSVYGRTPNRWTSAQVMQFIRRGGVVNNGNTPNRFAPTQQNDVRGRRATTPASSNVPTARRRGGGITPITYTPGTFETDVTPERFHEIIRTGDRLALKRLLMQQFDGRMLGKHKLTNIRVSGSGFEADITDANGNRIGSTRRSFTANSDGTVSVYNALMSIPDKRNRGGGFSSNYTEALYDMYRKLGVTKIGVTANIDDGGYTWGAAGFDFASGSVPPSIINRLKAQLSLAIADGRMQDAMNLNNLLQRALKGGRERPTALEIASIPGQLDYYPEYGGNLGRELMSEINWSGIRNVNTLEESLAFFEIIRRKNEARQRAQQNGQDQ